MQYKSANSHNARNAGLVAAGFMAAVILWSIIGGYCFIFPPLVGVVTYLSDKKNNNDPSMLDPIFTAVGGGWFAILLYVVHYL